MRALRKNVFCIFLVFLGLFISNSSFVWADKPASKASKKDEDKDVTPIPGVKPSQIGGVPVAPAIPDMMKVPDLAKSEIERFCGNVAIHAGDARSILQIQKMLQLKKDIEEKLRDLEDKEKEYKVWLKQRNALLELAKDSLVRVISKMKPSAAADQLALVDDYVAASLILKLNPRVSSAIMNELPASKAANLTNILVAVQNFDKDKKKEKATPAGQKN